MHALSTLGLLLASAVNSGTPLALAALGLLLGERSGVLNLGAEGLMLMAAVTGYGVAVHTGSDWLAFSAAALVGALMAALFGLLVIWLNTNQYATGLALSLFGSGLSAFVGLPLTQASLGQRSHYALPLLSEVPGIGPLASLHPLAYVSVIATSGLAWFLFRSKRGLIVRAVGESPESAHALGYSVRRIRLMAVMAGGALAGLAGAYVSLVSTRLWVEGMIAGKGWIALALTTFATWRPWRVLLGAYLFGGITILELHLQGQGVNIPVQLLSSLPYLATVFVLVLIARNPTWIRVNMPASLGKPFYPGS